MELSKMTDMKRSSPWLEAPLVWKSESAFWTWVRGGLRKALWSRYPVRNELKKELTWTVTEEERKTHNLSPRVRKVGVCSLTGGIFPASQLEVDHIIPAGKLNCWEDLAPWIERLLCPKENMRLVSKDAHKTHTYAEKMGISFEEALLEKKVIEFGKLTASKQRAKLAENGVSEQEMSSAAKRKNEYRKLLKETV